MGPGYAYVGARLERTGIPLCRAWLVRHEIPSLNAEDGGPVDAIVYPYDEECGQRRHALADMVLDAIGWIMAGVA